MHLVDTSIWIEFLRPNGSPRIQKQLKPLIQAGDVALTEWIILELMTGLRTNEQFAALLAQLKPIDRLSLAKDSWENAWELAAHLRKKGMTTSAAGCLIATIAVTHTAVLIHCDSDFELIAKHSDLKTLNWIPLL